MFGPTIVRRSQTAVFLIFASKKSHQQSFSRGRLIYVTDIPIKIVRTWLFSAAVAFDEIPLILSNSRARTGESRRVQLAWKHRSRREPHLTRISSCEWANPKDAYRRNIPSQNSLSVSGTILRYRLCPTTIEIRFVCWKIPGECAIENAARTLVIQDQEKFKRRTPG